jgi:hypothetical protein
MSSNAISRYPKFLPADGTIPEKAAFVCRTCKQWFASSCGKTSHIKNQPTHTLFSPKTGREWQGSTTGINRPVVPAFYQNGHSDIPQPLLEYAFNKMREEIDSQLDRLHEKLIPPSPKGTRRTYVAR